MKRKGQTPITGIIKSGIILGGLVAGVFFLRELQSLLGVIINNLLYLSIFGLITIVGGIGLIQLVRQERIKLTGFAAGFTLLLTLALMTPVAAGEVEAATTSWQATVEVKTSQAEFGLSEVKFDGIGVTDVSKSGPTIFPSTKTACTAFCGEYSVDITVTCEGMEAPKEVSIAGTTNQNPTKKVGPLPSNSQCRAVGVMTRPEGHVGVERSVASFVTRENR